MPHHYFMASYAPSTSMHLFCFKATLGISVSMTSLCINIGLSSSFFFASLSIRFGMWGKEKIFIQTFFTRREDRDRWPSQLTGNHLFIVFSFFIHLPVIFVHFQFSCSREGRIGLQICNRARSKHRDTWIQRGSFFATNCMWQLLLVMNIPHWMCYLSIVAVHVTSVLGGRRAAYKGASAPLSMVKVA